MPATCANANACSNGLNAFEREILRDPKVIDKLEAKEVRRRRGLAGMRRQWANGNLDPMTMAKKLAEANGATGSLDWMEIYGDIEERNKETLKKVAKLRKQLIYARYPREPWEPKPKARKGKRAAAAAEGDSEGDSEGELD
jgi:hypothetical protein